MHCPLSGVQIIAEGMYFVNADAASKTTDYKTDWLHFYAVYHQEDPFSQQNKLHFDLATD